MENVPEPQEPCMGQPAGEALLRHFSPVVLLEDARTMAPLRAEDVLPTAELRLDESGRKSHFAPSATQVLLPKGRVTAERLVALGLRHPHQNLSLRTPNRDWGQDLSGLVEPQMHAACRKLTHLPDQQGGYEITYLFFYLFQRPRKLFGIWEVGLTGVDWVHVTVRVSAGGVMECVCFNRHCNSPQGEWVPASQVPKVDGKILISVPKEGRFSAKAPSGQKKSPLMMLREDDVRRVWNPSDRISLDVGCTVPPSGPL